METKPELFKKTRLQQSQNPDEIAKYSLKSTIKDLLTTRRQPINFRTSNLIHPSQILNNSLEVSLSNTPVSNKHSTIIIWGNVSKDYISSSDLIKAISLINHSTSHEIVNVGSGSCFTTKDLVFIAQSTTPIPIKTITFAQKPHDTYEVTVDLTKLKTLTNWFPQTDMRSYLKEVIKAQLAYG